MDIRYSWDCILNWFWPECDMRKTYVGNYKVKCAHYVVQYGWTAEQLNHRGPQVRHALKFRVRFVGIVIKYMETVSLFWLHICSSSYSKCEFKRAPFFVRNYSWIQLVLQIAFRDTTITCCMYWEYHQWSHRNTQIEIEFYRFTLFVFLKKTISGAALQITIKWN